MSDQSKDIARNIVEFVRSKKAEDVVLLDLREVTTMTDFFLICSGASDVQVRAIADAVTVGCKEKSYRVYGVEGYSSLSWVLIDLVDVVVHVFKPETRDYYQLERLWGDAEFERFEDEDEEAIQ